MALHGLVARDDVLGIAGQQVAIVRQAVRKRRAVEEHEFVLAVIAGRTAFDGLLESVVLIPVVEHGLLQLGEAGVRRDVGALLAGSSLRIHMIGGFAHRMLLVWRFHYFTLTRTMTFVRLPHAATAVPPRLPRSPLSFTGSTRPLDVRLFGPIPPVLLGLRSHRAIYARRPPPFFRKLPADDGSLLCFSVDSVARTTNVGKRKSRMASTMRLFLRDDRGSIANQSRQSLSERISLR